MDPLSTSNTSNVTNTSGVTPDKKALTQSKETDLSKRIPDLKVGDKTLTHMASVEEMAIKERVKADKTTQKALRNELVHAKLRPIKVKISESNIKAERKAKLEQEAESLYKDFKTIKQAQEEGKRFTQIYIMEGATGVQRSVRRSSSDPDENMALASIVFLTKAVEQATVVAVPDEANCRCTLKFIDEVGGKAVPLSEHYGSLKSDVIYISSMTSKEEMSQIGELTKEGREITVLGPPLDEVHLLVTGENGESTKKVGGWQAAVEGNENPWDFANFEKSFNTNGKQVPYDTLVVYAAALGKPKLGMNDGDKALLLIL